MTDLTTKNVLVVEDETLNVALITAMLKIVGITNVMICKSGAELTAAIPTLPRIDLVLLDLQLPKEDGYAIFERLRAIPAFAGSRIAAVTAQVMPDDIQHAETVGFDGFIGKPLNFDRFPDQIRRLLAGERVWDMR